MNTAHPHRPLLTYIAYIHYNYTSAYMHHKHTTHTLLHMNTTPTYTSAYRREW